MRLPPRWTSHPRCSWMFVPGLLLQKEQLEPRLLEFCVSRFLLLLTEFGTHWAAATIAIPLLSAIAQKSHSWRCETASTERYKSLADVDVVEQRVYDYGRGTVSPVSRLPHCTLVALAMLAPPVINDFESQNRSVPFPLIWVKGFVPVPTATVDRLATTKPP